MKILIIEDDEHKRDQLYKFLSEITENQDIYLAKSLQSGLKAIVNDNYDLIILDMTLPTFDIGRNEYGGRPRAFGGLEILRQMSRREITTSVIVVTQFDRFGEGDDSLSLEELDIELCNTHNMNYKGYVYYNAAIDDWKNNLLNLIESIHFKKEH